MSTGMGYLAISVVHLRGSVVYSDGMVKISSVFLALSVFGGTVLVYLFIHSTLLIASNPGYGRVLEPRRERSKQRTSIFANSHKDTNFSLKDYKNRLSQELSLMKLDHPEEGRIPLRHRDPKGLSPSHRKGVDAFLNSRNGPHFGQVVQGEDELDAAVDLATRFPFRSDFSFPQPKVMRSLEYISRASWVTDLRHYLSTYNYSREISLVTSNSKYTDVLLNWLIAATVKSEIPTRSILVISLDSTIHRLMLAKQFCSILVPPWTLIAKGVNFSQPFDAVMMTRLAMMRIINHFGYDFVMYDSDAVILQDPQSLYDALPHEDIIGSVGKIPYDLAAAWGITICIGVVLVRSSPRTETYWNSMKDVCHNSVDDQEKLNCGLKALSISWLNNDSSYQDTTVSGVGSNLLRVSILPYDYICRQLRCIAENRSDYFIWHKGGQRSRRDKLRSARDGQTWFLKYKWEKIKNMYTGTKWLESIAYYTVLHA